MQNKVLLWAKPEKAGVLLKRAGNAKSWRKRQFILKDSYLFYFKVKASVDQSEPTGLIPLRGCKIGNTSAVSDSSIEHIFIITLPEALASLGILKHTNYVLAAEDYEDMQSWIDAIKLASVSKRKLQAKVEHAYMEVRDLEKRWAVAKLRDAYRSAGKKAPPLTWQTTDEPVILQALADMLMEAYHMRELLQNRVKDAFMRLQEASAYLEVLERAASVREESVMARKDMQHVMSKIHTEMAACSQSLEWLVPARFEYYHIEKQVEALEGSCENGEGVPSSIELESILQETLKRLEELEIGTWLAPFLIHEFWKQSPLLFCQRYQQYQVSYLLHDYI
ncbi:hypothetical protein KP509_02G026200 [Ceratopteris richardii]|uniref:PH domain-containing protein n=1 Tax=Ceratopteris richardii TaxID=49495 RepID=A0A8T2V7M4_CERRI|nr:hypothetical protein KP509_02G026200 [Ceratopteris richardii]KAH7443220.1 hypothetical protein KP509_02G026200 [Ceratopteris richardii]